MAEGALEQIAKQNDRQAAIDEFRQHYRLSPNAEELITANAAAYSNALTQASLSPVDMEATDELDMSEVAGMTTVSGATLSDMGEVLAAAVRGNAIVAVVLRPDGRTVKEVLPANDSYVAPRETPSEAASRQSALSNVELTQEVWKLREELSAELADLRAEREGQVAETIAEKQEEHAEAVESAGAEAAEAEAEAVKAQAEGFSGVKTEPKGKRSTAKKDE